jgi:hypothetical protein
MTHHAIKDAPPMSIVVHSELEEMAQKTPALRNAKSERIANARGLGGERLPSNDRAT